MTITVEYLRESRKSPSVLKIKVLKIRGDDPNVFIFIFEGIEDVPVYEEWLKRIDCCPRYEPLPGSGKQQLLAYCRSLIASGDPLLKGIYFFVDRDFDPPFNLDHLFELEAHSIENLLCTEEVLDSILKDEFRRAGAVGERLAIRGKFNELRTEFSNFCRPVNLHLFIAQRNSIKIIKKPEKTTEIVEVKVNSVSAAYLLISDVVQLEDGQEQLELGFWEDEFEKLPSQLKLRGKYMLDMFRRWLRALAEDVKSANPIMFSVRDGHLPGDPSNLSLRRLASSTPVPECLNKFMTDQFA